MTGKRKGLRKETPFSDPKNRYVAKGNRNAAGPHKNGRNFITQQLIACLNDKWKDEKQKKATIKNGKRQRILSRQEMTKYAKMCETLVDMAIKDRDLAAMEFIWDRIEGKVTTKVAGKIDHAHSLKQIARDVSDEELAVLERVSRRMLEAQGGQVIDATATEVTR